MYLRGTSRRLGKYEAVPVGTMFGLFTYTNIAPTTGKGLGCACDSVRKQFSGLGDNYAIPGDVQASIDYEAANPVVTSDPNIYNLPGLTNGPVYPVNSTYNPQTQSVLNAGSSPGASPQLQALASQLALTAGIPSVPSPTVVAPASSLSSTTILLGGGALLLIAMIASGKRR